MECSCLHKALLLLTYVHLHAIFGDNALHRPNTFCYFAALHRPTILCFAMPGGERIKDLKAILSRVCEVATLFDDDGLTVRFMNSKLEGNNVKTSSAAGALVDRVKFEGMTPLGTNLDAKIIQPLFTALVKKKALPKPVLVIVITDGEPTGEPADRVVQVIKNAKALATNSLYGSGSIAFEFAQVGKDAAAQAFLARLDKHPDIGRMIDATSYFELEQEEYKRKGVNLTPDVWLVKLMVGAVDPTFDEQD